MDRRQFVASIGSAAVVGLAGCASPDGAGGDRAGVPPPSVPTRRLSDAGWEQTANPPPSKAYDERIGGFGRVTATENTVIYEDTALNRRLREDTLGEFPGDDDALRIFFATRVDVRAPGDIQHWPVVRSEIVDGIQAAATDQFEEELRENGISDIARTEAKQITVDSGDEARVTRFEGSYRYDAMTIPVTEKKSMSLDGGTIAVHGLVAVWYGDDSVLVAGGAFPAESFERRITSELTDAITVTVDIDLGLEPEAYRTELRELVTAVR